MTDVSKVSVIIPMYNHRRFIERAIISVVLQTYRPIELIVIDDGSTDGTAQEARLILNKLMPSAILIERQNRGAAQTINEAIGIARGEYINILNSDDEFVPHRLEECISAAKRYNRDMIYGSVEFVDEDGMLAAEDQYLRDLNDAQTKASTYPTLGFALMRNQLAISTGNFFFSRKLYDKVGPFRSYKYVHDWDFILRSVFYTEPLALNSVLYKYRLHGNNSFRDLAHIAGYETSEVMRNFLWSMVSRMPENGRAPCPHYWPGVFQILLERWNYQTYMPPSMRRHDGLRM